MIFTPGTLVFDIGAHYGESVDKFQGRHRAGLVVSVEACFESYARLVESIRLNRYCAVPVHAACWNVRGLMHLRRCGTQSGLSTVRHDVWSQLYPAEAFEPQQMVAAITVEDLFEKFGQPAYVKIDVEGAEFEVISGFGFCDPKVVTFEFHGARAEDAVRCLELLRGRKYAKATMVEADVDVMDDPAEPMAEFIERFKSAPPQWGNITVSK